MNVSGVDLDVLIGLCALLGKSIWASLSVIYTTISVMPIFTSFLGAIKACGVGYA